MQFINFVDIKGVRWYDATEVCLALGYPINKASILNAPNLIGTVQLVNNEVYWNTITLERFKDVLTKASGEGEKYLENWDYLEKCMKNSVKETFLQSKGADSEVEKAQLYIEAYKYSDKSFKGFITAVRRRGIPSGFSSWQKFSIVYPDVYKEIEKLMPVRNKNHQKVSLENKESYAIK